MDFVYYVAGVYEDYSYRVTVVLADYCPYYVYASKGVATSCRCTAQGPGRELYAKACIDPRSRVDTNFDAFACV